MDIKLKYFALDIETTGLDSKNDQIVQIGLIFDDFRYSDYRQQPKICFDIWHEYYYSSSAFALALNTPIFKRLGSLANPPNENVWSPSDSVIHERNVLSAMEWFVREHIGQEKPVFAGKNVGSFDLQFDPLNQIKRHHRTIDVGSMYLLMGDKEPPSMDECLKRAGQDKSVTHDALDDCYDVIRCVRYSLLGVT